MRGGRATQPQGVRFGERGESKEEEETGGEEVVRGCPLNFTIENILIPTAPACPPFSPPLSNPTIPTSTKL
jgi:hypothetical protein